MRVLATTIRKLEVMGCVRRVKAKSVHSRTTQATHRSIKFIRDPIDREWNLQWYYSNALAGGLRNEENAAENEDEVDDAEANESGLSNNSTNTSREPTAAPEGRQLQASGRKVPQWTTDRPMSHQLFNLIEAAGTQGISTMVGTLMTTFEVPRDSNPGVTGSESCKRRSPLSTTR